MIVNATQELPVNLFFKSTVVGTVAATAAGVLAFALAPFFDAVGAYMKPAAFLMPAIGRMIPSRALDWVIPDGGPVAGVLLMMVCTLLFWVVVFGGSYFAWIKLKHKHGMQQTLGPNSR
jgi:hypothetical protein